MRSFFRRCELFQPCCRVSLRRAEAFRRLIIRPHQPACGRHGLACPQVSACPTKPRLQLATNQHNVASSEGTIYALSTAPGRAAIAVIRVSGPSCVEIYHALCPGRKVPQPRNAVMRTLYDPKSPPTEESILDSSALVLFFPAPHTVTGEDVLELHVHGGPAIVKAVLKAISTCPASHGRIRYAEPGEFTWRGFLNDRFDLTQVEALGESLSATTEQQRRLSIRGTAGRLAKQYEEWRLQLLNARGELEALIDFQEDQNFDESPAVLAASVAVQVEALKRRIKVHISNAVRGEMLRNGISVALLGAPNAGKSSLLNRIVGREAAIVSTEAGTTRDVVEVGVDIGGYLCRLGDMAGLRTDLPLGSDSVGATNSQNIGLVEAEGIRRAKQRALESDIILVVIPVDVDNDGNPDLQLNHEVISNAHECIANGGEVVVLINKIDLLPLPLQDKHIATWKATIRGRLPVPAHRIFPISCKDSSQIASSSLSADTGNIGALLDGLLHVFHDMTSALTLGTEHDSEHCPDRSIWQESLGASERHRLLLESCFEYLQSFLSQADAGTAHQAHPNAPSLGLDVVVAAESLRAAADCLARITGRGECGDVEDVLGVVFSKFCVGK